MYLISFLKLFLHQLFIFVKNWKNKRGGGRAGGREGETESKSKTGSGLL